MAEGDGIDVNVNWDFAGLFQGIGESLGNMGSSIWTSTKEAGDEGVAAVVGVAIILVAGVVIWRAI